MEEVFIQSEETVAVLEGMGADEKIGQDATRSWSAMPSTSGHGSLKRATRDSPNQFVQVPIHENPCVAKESIEKRFVSGWERQQLPVHRRRDDKVPAIQGRIQRGTDDGTQRLGLIPERDEDIGVNRRRHVHASCERSE